MNIRAFRMMMWGVLWISFETSASRARWTCLSALKEAGYSVEFRDVKVRRAYDQDKYWKLDRVRERVLYQIHDLLLKEHNDLLLKEQENGSS